MQLGKIVSITCLTYIVYGITSAFQLGTFLPPIPLKPFIYLFFVLLGLGFGVYLKVSQFNYIMLIWMAIYAMNSTAFLEVFFSSRDVVTYENTYEIIGSLIMMIFFSFHSVVFLFAITQNDRRYGIFFLPLIGGIVYHFMASVELPFNAIIICWALLVFILDRNCGDKLPGLFRLTPVLYGAGIIEVVEIISLVS